MTAVEHPDPGVARPTELGEGYGAASGTSNGAATDNSTPADGAGFGASDVPASESPSGIGPGVEHQLRRLDGWQQRHEPMAVLVGVIKKFGDDQAGNLAALVAYYAFFSLFPLLLLLTTILGFVLADDPAAQQSVVTSVLDRFPGLGDQLASNIGSFQGSGIAVVVGALGALWGGLGALGSMQNAMNTIWAVRFDKRPPFLVERARSLIMLVVLGTGAIVTTIVTNIAGSVEGLPLIARGLVIAVTLALNIGLFLLAFKVLTRHGLDWKQLVPGAVVAGVAFLLLQSVGGWYISRTLGHAAPLYGTFAVVLGLLTWLYLQAQLTMLAAELNVVLARRLYPRSLIGTDLADLTAADERALVGYATVQRRHPHQRVAVTFSSIPADDDDLDPDDVVPPARPGAADDEPPQHAAPSADGG